MKRKLETVDETDSANTIIAKKDESDTSGEPKPAKRARISKNENNEDTQNSNNNNSKSGFSFGNFTFGNKDSSNQNVGFGGLGFGSEFGSTNANLGFGDSCCNKGSDTCNKKEKKIETPNQDNSISAWSTTATESNVWTFDNESNFTFDSFGSSNDAKSVFGGSFGSFGSFGSSSSDNTNNNNNNNNDSNSNSNDKNSKTGENGENNENNNNSNKNENGSKNNWNNGPKVELLGAVDPGDTDDITHFEARCKIYKLKNGQWKEKGVGEVKVNSVKHSKIDTNESEKKTDENNTNNNEKTQTKENENENKNENKKQTETEKENEKDNDKKDASDTVIDSARLLCRREKIGKLILNEFIQKDTKFVIERKKFLRVAFVSPKNENDSDNEEEAENAKDKTEDKTNESQFVVNTYLIRPADTSKLEELADAIEIVQQMLASPK